MTTALAYLPRRRQHHASADDVAAVAVIPALGPLPPLIVRTMPRRLDSRTETLTK